MTAFWKSPWLPRVVFLLCLAPALWLVWLWHNNRLGINQLELVARYSGSWTLRMLLISLAITPLRRLPGLSPLVRFRRMTGLFAFFYGTLHALHYFGLDVQWDMNIIKEDLTFRRFFIAGMVSLLLMLPLALTSFDAAIRKLGGKRWRLLHRLAYLAGIAGVVHFLWQGKSIDPRPVQYALILALLLLTRVVYAALDYRRRLRRA